MAKSGIRGSVSLTKEIAQVKLSACTYNTALAMPQVATDPPATDTTTGYALIAVGGQNYVAVMFAGTATGEILGWQAVGWQPTRNGSLYGSVPEKLGEGLATYGTLALGAKGIFIESAAALWADTITETSSNPATRVYSPGNNEAAILIIDAGRFSHITIQVSRNGQDATTMTVVTQVADSIGGALANIEIADTGLATAVLQTTGNTALGQIETAIEKIDHLTAANSGNKDAATQRVVLATDDIPTALVNTNIGANDAAVASQGGVGSLSAKLRLVTSQLNTIDADTGSIKLATEGTEDEIDGTTSDGPLADIVALLKAVPVLGSGQELLCVANTTNYNLTVVAGATYKITTENGTIYIGEADSTSDANRMDTITTGMKAYYTAIGTTLHYSTEDGAGIIGRLSRIVNT